MQQRRDQGKLPAERLFSLLHDLELIPDAPDRLEAPLVRHALELFAQALDMHVDGAAVAEIVKAPDLVEQLIARDRPGSGEDARWYKSSISLGGVSMRLPSTISSNESRSMTSLSKTRRRGFSLPFSPSPARRRTASMRASTSFISKGLVR